MFGQYDGLAIAELPDSAAAASLSLATTSSGAFKQFETHELIATDELVRILERAKEIQPSYQPPGATTS